jgi:predicted  nucleic acid-binding Zn-ribbon protein
MDFYSYLVDINSLDNVIKRHNAEIEEELKRLTFLEQQKENKNELLNEATERHQELKTQQVEKEKLLFDIDHKLEQNSNHQLAAKTTKEVETLEHEKSHLEVEKNILENNILEMIEEVDNLDQKIAECDEFLGGLAKTIVEIETEVETFRHNKEKEIRQLEKQIEGLLCEIPSTVIEDMTKTREKYRFHNFVTYLDGSVCHHCKFKNSPVECDIVTKQNRHMHCGGCKRILINKSYF